MAENTAKSSRLGQSEEGTTWQSIALNGLWRSAQLLASGIVTGAGLAIGQQFVSKRLVQPRALPGNVVDLSRKVG